MSDATTPTVPGYARRIARPCPGPLFSSALRRARDPSESLFALMGEPSVIGDPPGELRALHRPGFVNIFWSRIRYCIEHPVDVDLSLGIRRVQVLGLVVFEHAPDGRIEAAEWVLADNGAPIRRECTQATAIAGVPYGDGWIERFRPAFAVELAERVSADWTRIEPYTRWVFARFLRKIRAECNLARMRAEIAKGIGADPALLSIARSLVPRSALSTSWPTLTSYNHLVEHGHAYHAVAREAPNLLPWFSALVLDKDFPAEGEPVQRLRRHLVAHGRSPRLWRLLCQAKGRLLTSFLPFYRHDSATAARDLLEVLDLLELRRPPPSWFLWHVLQTHGGPQRPRASYAADLVRLRQPLRRLAQILERASPDVQQTMRENLHRVLGWLHEWDPALDERLRRVGWPWFARRAQAWDDARIHNFSKQITWPVPIERTHFGKYDIVPLHNARDLWEESSSMRHCADDYVTDCIAGLVAVVSVRRPGRARPMASLRFERNQDRWVLSQAVAFANAAPHDALQPVFAYVTARMNRQTSSDRSP